MTVAVTIRHLEQDKGVSMGQFDPAQIPKLVKLVKEYGHFTMERKCQFCMAHFVGAPAVNMQAYFEVVVEDVPGNDRLKVNP